MSTKHYKSWTPAQMYLLPPSPREWLPEGHLAYFILDLIPEIDLSRITLKIQEKDPRGERPYPPEMMIALLIYGYCIGVYSSRRLAKATYEDIAFRVIAGENHPHFTRINEFRRTYREEFQHIFLQVLKLCQRAGLVKLGHVALDGTKMTANASKHKAMSYKRMQETEKRLKQEIVNLLARAQEIDDAEDDRFGTGHDEENIPAELKRREDRLARIKQARIALEKEARQARAQELIEQAQRARHRSQTSADPVDRKRAATLACRREEKARKLLQDNGDDDGDGPLSFTTMDGLPKHRPPTTTDGAPTPKAQRNFVDPDSRIMKRGGEYLQGYNAQAAVDEEHQIIVGQAVTNQCPDNGNLCPMLEQVKDNCGHVPIKATADSGYWAPDAPDCCEAMGIDVYIATERDKHSTSGQSPPERPLSTDADPRAKMKNKTYSRKGRAIYARRKAVVEPVFGQIKEARRFRRFSLRGLVAVQAEWSLVCACHNILKIFNARLDLGFAY